MSVASAYRGWMPRYSPSSTEWWIIGSLVRYRTKRPSTSLRESPASASASRAATAIIDSSLWSATLPSGDSATPVM